MSCPGKEMGFTCGIPVSRRQREKYSISCVSERSVLEFSDNAASGQWAFPVPRDDQSESWGVERETTNTNT